MQEIIKDDLKSEEIVLEKYLGEIKFAILKQIAKENNKKLKDCLRELPCYYFLNELKEKYNFTEKEIHIIKLLVDETKKISCIAKELNKSEVTIKTHLQNIYKKLGISCLPELHKKVGKYFL